MRVRQLVAVCNELRGFEETYDFVARRRRLARVARIHVAGIAGLPVVCSATATALSSLPGFPDPLSVGIEGTVGRREAVRPTGGAVRG